MFSQPLIDVLYKTFALLQFKSKVMQAFVLDYNDHNPYFTVNKSLYYVITGFTTNIPQLLSGSDGFVLRSLNEGP